MAMYKTKKDAAYAWVQEFNAIPQSVIEKLAKVDLEENGEGITEITPPSCGDRIYIFSGDHYGGNGEIRSYNEDNNTYKICLDGTGEEVDVREDDFEVERDDFFPMWGTMWQFSDSCDNWWLENHLQEMADCGWQIADSVSTSKRILSTFSALMVVATTFMRLIGFRFMKSVVFIGTTKL